MSDEQLRRRLAALDPLPPDIPVASPLGPRARDQLERIMATDLDVPTRSAAPRPGPWRRPAVLAAAAVLAAGVATGAVLLTRPDASPGPTRAGSTLTLTAPGGGGVSIGSCLPFSVAVLRDMPVAFAGTVTATTPEQVTLSVDRWYRGGSAAQVVLRQVAGGMPASVAGVEFTEGGHYLVTATNGEVNGCGFSGPATPELEQAYAEAFGS